mmetsp:Transcript_65562/g.181757  ORF Transcript_65562/g.181757 Transcript_65562/m.181757 type:complete len:299 (-) Transcript_65562:115-1011(-)|eukprot:CAMPEP_0179137628 /NCGR_PEP_ID=MMETSP0796-20121207/65666_1 /TAXON_ID=73915 /ORGANISM="Pyrodinium bahamense, Strain pbaha01" /LENGTH=298 /DNA_ID=CAMNT_0020836821 /DNA_START=25 /DNA_END=921 /DNA_ORIENTATION=-
MDNLEEEARQRLAARQAAERALLALDRMPEPLQSQLQLQPPLAATTPEAAAPAAASLPCAAPATASEAQWPAAPEAMPMGGLVPPEPAGVAPTAAGAAYRPPGWATSQRKVERSPPAPELEGGGISMSMCGCGGTTTDGNSIDQQLFALAGLSPPSEESFGRFFRTWFELEFFPGMSKALQSELVQRARSKGFFSGLSSQVKKWAMANTDARLQSDAWCAYFEQNAPPRFRTFGCVRTAAVNLGAQVQPCWVTFWGIPDAQGDRWILPPWTSTNADIGAVLDELDGRGGMAALVAAAA